MTQQRAKPTTPVLDPDSVQETLCDGRFHFYSHGNLATLTFTHNRPEPNDLFGGEINMEEIVRARITMTLANFVALRDLLNQLFKDAPVQQQAPTSGSAGGGDKVHCWWQGTFGLGSHEDEGHLCGQACAPCRTHNAFALMGLSAYGIATKGKPWEIPSRG